MDLTFNNYPNFLMQSLMNQANNAQMKVYSFSGGAPLELLSGGLALQNCSLSIAEDPLELSLLLHRKETLKAQLAQERLAAALRLQNYTKVQPLPVVTHDIKLIYSNTPSLPSLQGMPCQPFVGVILFVYYFFLNTLVF